MGADWLNAPRREWQRNPGGDRLASPAITMAVGVVHTDGRRQHVGRVALIGACHLGHNTPTLPYRSFVYPPRPLWRRGVATQGKAVATGDRGRRSTGVVAAGIQRGKAVRQHSSGRLGSYNTRRTGTVRGHTADNEGTSVGFSRGLTKGTGCPDSAQYEELWPVRAEMKVSRSILFVNGARIYCVSATRCTHGRPKADRKVDQ